MAKRTLYQQFDEALESMISGPDAPAAKVGPKLAALLRIAADLRDLPRPEFKARLARELAGGRVAKRRVARSRKTTSAARATSRKFPVTATQQASEQEHPMRPKSIPEGFHSITPFLHVRDINRTLEFIERTFGAQRTMLAEGGEPVHTHAEVRLGDSMIMLGSEVAEYQARPAPLHVYVDDVDAIYRRALDADVEEVRPPVEQDYGDREMYIKDRAGNHWYVATHRTDADPLPPEIRSVNPFFHPQRSTRVIDFLKDAFGADEVFRGQAPDGTVYHAKIRIGDSIVEMGDAHGEWQPMPMSLYLYVDDADAAYRRALAAGATSIEAPTDKEWGDRVATVRDPFDDIWFIASHAR